MEKAVFSGIYANLDKIGEFYSTGAELAGFDEKSAYDVQLAVDEAAANIIEHAYGGENIGDIECCYEVQPNKLIVKMKDFGKPFDPDLIEEPELGIDPCGRKPGGLGLHFMRSLMDSLEFSFNGNGGNVLTMVKTRTETANPS